MHHTKVNGWVIGQTDNPGFEKLNNVIIVPHNGLSAVTDLDNFQRVGLMGKPFRYWAKEVNVVVGRQAFSLCDFCDNEFDRMFNRCSFESSLCTDQKNIDKLVSGLRPYGKPELEVEGEFVKPGYCVAPFQLTTLENMTFDDSLIEERKQQLKSAVQSRLQLGAFRKSQCKDCFLTCQWIRCNMREGIKCQISEEEYRKALLQQIRARFGSVGRFLELSSYGGMKLRFSKRELPVGGRYVITCPVNRHAFLITKPHYPFDRFIIEKSMIPERPEGLKIKNKEEVACMLAAFQNSSSLGVTSVPLWRVQWSGRIWIISMRPERDCIAIDASQSKKYSRTTAEFGSLKAMMSRLEYHYYSTSGYAGLSPAWMDNLSHMYRVDNKSRWNQRAKLLAKHQERIDLKRLRNY